MADKTAAPRIADDLGRFLLEVILFPSKKKLRRSGLCAHDDRPDLRMGALPLGFAPIVVSSAALPLKGILLLRSGRSNGAFCRTHLSLLTPIKKAARCRFVWKTTGPDSSGKPALGGDATDEPRGTQDGCQ